MNKCDECKGSGQYVGLFKSEPCKLCGGTGERRQEHYSIVPDFEGKDFKVGDAVDTANLKEDLMEYLGLTESKTMDVSEEVGPTTIEVVPLEEGEEAWIDCDGYPSKKEEPKLKIVQVKMSPQGLPTDITQIQWEAKAGEEKKFLVHVIGQARPPLSGDVTEIPIPKKEDPKVTSLGIDKAIEGMDITAIQWVEIPQPNIYLGTVSELWEVVRIYYGLLSATTELIRKGLSEQKAKEMADHLSENPGSTSTVYEARPQNNHIVKFQEMPLPIKHQDFKFAAKHVEEVLKQKEDYRQNIKKATEKRLRRIREESEKFEVDSHHTWITFDGKNYKIKRGTQIQPPCSPGVEGMSDVQRQQVLANWSWNLKRWIRMGLSLGVLVEEVKKMTSQTMTVVDEYEQQYPDFLPMKRYHDPSFTSFLCTSRALSPDKHSGRPIPGFTNAPEMIDVEGACATPEDLDCVEAMLKNKPRPLNSLLPYPNIHVPLNEPLVQATEEAKQKHLDNQERKVLNHFKIVAGMHMIGPDKIIYATPQ